MKPEVLAVLFAALVAMLLILVFAPRRPVRGDRETDIVMSLAYAMAGTTDSHTLTAAHVVRAALCNAVVGDSLARAGLNVDVVDQWLRGLGGDYRDVADLVWVKVTRAPEVQAAIDRAARAARRRGESEFTLIDLLTALMKGSDDVAQYLSSVSPDLDETLYSSTRGLATDNERFVYVWNDDTSPMPIVVTLLRQVFDEDFIRATYLMLSIHHRGFATLGPFDPRRAEQLIDDANATAAELEIPVQVRDVAPDTSTWRHTETHGLLPSV